MPSTELRFYFPLYTKVTKQIILKMFSAANLLAKTDTCDFIARFCHETLSHDKVQYAIVHVAHCNFVA